MLKNGDSRDRHGHAAYHKQTLVTSFLVISPLMTLKDPDLPK